MKLLSDNMAINVQMLGSFMEYMIGSFVNSTLIVTEKNRKLRALNVKISKQVKKSLEFTCS